jgi:hypothetical protein
MVPVAEMRTHRLGVHIVPARIPPEPHRSRLRNFGGLRLPFGDPLIPAAIEDRDGEMAEPAQQPPKPRGDHAALRIVGDDLFPRVDAGVPELSHQCGGVG